MSVIVKGMRLPEKCSWCPIARSMFDGDKTRLRCLVLCEWVSDDGDGRLGDCPLVELPEEHGRLIDADALKESVFHHLCIKGEDNLLPAEKSVFGNIIKAPTVAEAEEKR